ncbi:hypothetical protein F4779DRAFT_595883 [Xylariaceae sp. FL0662B]|nr:hypothetical protein F4779DRAFT_595883 [Xylariaceae sp. FL0662B]
MKLLLGASLASLFTTGLAGPLIAPFVVSKFSAGATPHSAIGFVELTWSYSKGLNSTRCAAQPGTYQVFPSVEQTTCSDPLTSFNLTRREDGGADLQLWYGKVNASMIHAVHPIEPEQIVWSNQQSPTGTVQVYAGPQNFSVKADYL